MGNHPASFPYQEADEQVPVGLLTPEWLVHEACKLPPPLPPFPFPHHPSSRSPCSLSYLEADEQVPVCLLTPEWLELDLEVVRVLLEQLSRGATLLLKRNAHLCAAPAAAAAAEGICDRGTASVSPR